MLAVQCLQLSQRAACWFQYCLVYLNRSIMFPLPPSEAYSLSSRVAQLQPLSLSVGAWHLLCGCWSAQT